MDNNLQFWIPVIISIIAIIFTGYQQFISNKQFLFDRRLSLYQLYKTLLKHQMDAKRYFNNKADDLCMHDMLINTLTNDSKLSLAVKGWNDRTDSDPLMKSDNHKIFLSMIEELRTYGTESSLIFYNHGQNLCNYFNEYADLCFEIYQYSILMTHIRNKNKKLNDGISLDIVKEKQKKKHKKLNQIYNNLCNISELIDLSDLRKAILFI